MLLLTRPFVPPAGPCHPRHGSLLRNKEMMAAISAVCSIVRCYCVRANEGDVDAMDTCNKLDAAGREQVLFKAFEVPDDDLKVGAAHGSHASLSPSALCPPHTPTLLAVPPPLTSGRGRGRGRASLMGAPL